MKPAQGSLSSFQNSFCMKYVIPPERFVREVFNRCVHEKSAGFSKFLLLVYPAFFRRDLVLIKQVGRAESLDEVKGALQRFHRETQDEGGLLRKKLKMRLSGERMLRLAAELFA